MDIQDSKNKILHYIPSKYYSNSDWINYARGYKNALINLIESVLSSENNSINKNEFIFPILSLYRHFIEIMLKQIIAEYTFYNESKSKIPKTHTLYDLWNGDNKKVANVKFLL